MKVLIDLILIVSSLDCATKHHRSKSSQNKPDNPDNTNILSFFLLILILNQSYNQTHKVGYLTYITTRDR